MKPSLTVSTTTTTTTAPLTTRCRRHRRPSAATFTVYTFGPNKGQKGPWHTCNRASCQFRGRKIATFDIDFNETSVDMETGLATVVDTVDELAEATVTINGKSFGMKRKGALPPGWLKRCLDGAKCVKRSAADPADAEEIEYELTRTIAHGAQTKTLKGPLRLKAKFKGAGWKLDADCNAGVFCNGLGAAQNITLPSDAEISALASGGSDPNGWTARFPALRYDAACVDGIKCAETDVTADGEAEFNITKNDKLYRLNIKVAAKLKAKDTVVSSGCAASVCTAAGSLYTFSDLTTLGGELITGAALTSTASASLLSSPSSVTTACIDASTVSCDSADGKVGPFVYSITKDGSTYNARCAPCRAACCLPFAMWHSWLLPPPSLATQKLLLERALSPSLYVIHLLTILFGLPPRAYSFYAGAGGKKGKGCASAASTLASCYDDAGKLNACDASGKCARAYCSASVSCDLDDTPDCTGYKAYSLGQWGQSCSKDTSTMTCFAVDQKGNPGCFNKGCIGETRMSTCPSGATKCSKRGTLHYFGEASTSAGACGPFTISAPSASTPTYIQLNSHQCIIDMLPSPTNSAVATLGLGTTITCGDASGTGSWGSSDAMPKNRLLNELLVSMMNVHCIATKVSNKNLEAVLLGETTSVDGTPTACSKFAGLTVSQVHAAAGDCLLIGKCVSSKGSATPTDLANCLNQLNKWTEMYS